MSAYHDDQEIRSEIDVYLRRNARRQSNLGLDSTTQERLAASREWHKDVKEIRKLDPEFARVVEAQE